MSFPSRVYLTCQLIDMVSAYLSLIKVDNNFLIKFDDALQVVLATCDIHLEYKFLEVD
jgi:hypothetical protein